MHHRKKLNLSQRTWRGRRANSTRKKVIIASITLSVILIPILGLLLCRQGIINKINSKITTFNKKNAYRVRVSIENIGFKGFNQINLSGLTIQNAFNDTLLSSSFLKKTIQLKDILTLHFSTDQLFINDVTIYHTIKYKKKGVPEKNQVNDNNPFDFPLDASNLSAEINDLMPDLRGRNYHLKLQRFYQTLFWLCNTDITIGTLTLALSINNYPLKVKLNNLDFNLPMMSREVTVYSNGDKQHFYTDIALSQEKIDLHIIPHHLNENIQGIKEITGALINFEKINIVVLKPLMRDQNALLTGTLAVSNFSYFNNSVSDTNIVCDDFSFHYNIQLGDRSIKLDSSFSTVTFNDITFKPYVFYEKDEYARLEWAVNKSPFAAQKLFHALPKGMFHSLKGIKTKGRLSYSMYGYLDTREPDSIKFESSLQKHGFKIEEFGDIDFTQINDPFTYPIGKNGKIGKTIEVSHKNKNFTPFNTIPSHLIYAVLTSEDCQFFKHKGFSLESFRNSLIKNLRKRRFARGGSTITMQVVKNTFLSHKKNIERKLEEMLIVWLIEHNRLVSKKRLLEIYFNVIEWGPGINGIKEAAAFYFDKKVQELTLNEALFLTIIIPKPRAFKSCFRKHQKGVLRPYRSSRFNYIAQKMLERKFITEAEFALVAPHISLLGPALSFLNPTQPKRLKSRKLSPKTLN